MQLRLKRNDEERFSGNSSQATAISHLRLVGRTYLLNQIHSFFLFFSPLSFRQRLCIRFTHAKTPAFGGNMFEQDKFPSCVH
jgi:hypothetical protein